jgi:hypothetical protein
MLSERDLFDRPVEKMRGEARGFCDQVSAPSAITALAH